MLSFSSLLILFSIGNFAQGEDVPAPFMTFESAGFPPEILEEVVVLFFII